MKKIAFILLTWGCVLTLLAQQPDETAKRALEREVKTSGTYLYGEAVANTKDDAVKFAKTALVSEINKEILNNYDWQFANMIQAKDVEYYVEIIDLMRANKFRVIAYVKKENLTAVFQYNVMPEIELTDKDVYPWELEKIQQTDTYTSPAVDPTMNIYQPVEVEESAFLPEIPEFTIVDETSNRQFPFYGATSDDILRQILHAASPRQIQTILNSNKKNGKAAYGTMDKLMQPEAAYLIVFSQTGEIVAILDKGSASLRKDLISGVTYGREIFNNNQVIWFQLFNN